jgi:hypothetical protein
MSEMHGLLTDAPISAWELTLAKQMADALHRTYPGHLWAVDVNERAGMANIRNLYLSGNWGFRLKVAQTAHFSASDFERRVILAGGELLERYRVSRARMSPGRLVDAIDQLPVNFAGQHKADL